VGYGKVSKENDEGMKKGVRTWYVILMEDG